MDTPAHLLSMDTNLNRNICLCIPSYALGKEGGKMSNEVTSLHLATFHFIFAVHGEVCCKFCQFFFRDWGRGKSFFCWQEQNVIIYKELEGGGTFIIFSL